MAIIQVCPHVFQVGGGSLSSGADCCVYFLESEGQGAVIDTGAGSGADRIIDNIESGGFDPASIRYIILTHGHIDHIGGLNIFSQRLQAEIAAHRLELPAIEEGRPELTAAAMYGVKYKGIKVGRVLQDDEEIKLGSLVIHCPHTPGHTPGGISPYVDIEGQRVLFGQDIHGPFSRQWGSDMAQWRNSMKKLLDLKADILCEGHFGIYSPAQSVEQYINGYLKQYAK